jgi:hypothetical protein
MRKIRNEATFGSGMIAYCNCQLTHKQKWRRWQNFPYQTPWQIYKSDLINETNILFVLIIILTTSELTYKTVRPLYMTGEPLFSNVQFYIKLSTTISTDYFKQSVHSQFSLENAVSFIRLKFSSCIIQTLLTECAKISI